MGNNPSKSQSAPSTPMKSFSPNMGIANNKREETSPPPPSPTNLPEPVLDPRSPNIERTPITNILSRFNNKNIEKTPTNILRNNLLRDFGIKYTEKELDLLDPRSPTVNVPRTPIHFNDDNASEISAISEPYCSMEDGECIEASCRAFNEKISNITLDDSDHEEEKNNLSDELECIRRKYMETHFEFGDEEKLSEDPRSPSTNVFRTPIIFGTVPKIAVDNPTKECNDIEENDECIKTEIFKENDIESNLPISSSTPTVPVATDTSTVKAHNLEKLNKIYEDNGDELPVQNNENAIIMTPVRKFIKKEMHIKPRTPLGVLNRRSKSAENLSQKQSRNQQNDAGNNTLNSKINKNQEVDENFTPKSMKITKRNQTSHKQSQSRIPVFKKIN